MNKKNVFVYFILTFSLFCSKDQKENFLIENLLKEKQIEYFFTNPIDTFENERIKKEIIKVIENSRESLYIFSYDFDEPDIISTIENAIKRNVNTKILLSNDQNYNLLNLKKIPYEVYDGTGIQHMKLILSDHKILFAGTGNFSKSSIFYNSDFYFKISIDEFIAQKLIQKIYYRNYDEPIIITSPFYTIKILNTPNEGGAIQNILNNEILKAQNYIEFFIFSFFDPTIMNSLFLKSKEDIYIRGIVDSTNTFNQSNIYFLKFLGKNNYDSSFIYIDNFPFQFEDVNGIQKGGKLHHKTMIIDNKIYTGSYNYSINARDKNLEIFFEIEDPYSFEKVKDFYEKLFSYSLPIFSKQNQEKVNFDTYISDNLFCQNDKGLSFFTQGKNAFLFVEFLDNQTCSNTKNNYSSGISTNPSDNFLHDQGIISQNYEFIKVYNQKSQFPFFTTCSKIFCDPCEIYDCKPFIFHDWNQNQKWFSTLENLDIQNIIIWDGSKVLQGEIISKSFLDNIFYYNYNINDSFSDAIIFSLIKKELFIGCLKKKNLRKNLKNFITLLSWYSKKKLNLLPSCLEIL